ncbi:histidine phosphatase family protein [Arundinibacter roseus]|uniref:Histidine phosphatase family protein n=1 Tax=Arundinibacter roseus TaxID=2070510 RepID=A0A4R4KJX7_9BACT|nr:histidine phosphatase family protein [Arundinibacter roseus]TDB66939.1 histidine phosphatase family protein [Arundinibacter roseus]
MLQTLSKSLVFALLLIGISSCSTSTIYLVRHAEKASQPVQDPPLTAIGEQRAEDLLNVLRDKNIQYVYSTPTARTQATAAPLAKQMNVEIRPYGTDTLWEVARHLAKLKNGNTLVVGHSNTLLPLLDQFPVSHKKSSIPDSDYDNLFIVEVKRRFLRPDQFTLTESTFGQPAE